CVSAHPLSSRFILFCIERSYPFSIHLFFFLMIRPPPRSTLFPTRRSSDLSGRSTRSSTRRSSSRMATRVSRGLPLINISRFKAVTLAPRREAPSGEPVVFPAIVQLARLSYGRHGQ